MVGIDWSAPLGLMDGTPVTAERNDDGDYRVTRIDGEDFTDRQVGEWAGGSTFFANRDGCHWLDDENDIVRIRNRVTDADKRLRDAAPALLEALRNFTDGRDLSYVDALEAAREVIAKATGQ